MTATGLGHKEASKVKHFGCADTGRRRGSHRRRERGQNWPVDRPSPDTVYGIGADAFDGDAVAIAACGQGPRAGLCPSVFWSARGAPSRRGLAHAVPQHARGVDPVPSGGSPEPGFVRQAPSLQWDLGDARGTVMLRMPHCIRWPSNCYARPDRWRCRCRLSQGVPPRSPVRGSRAAGALDLGLSRWRFTQQAASTIVDLTGPMPRVLREGPIGAATSPAVLGADVMASLTA